MLKVIILLLSITLSGCSNLHLKAHAATAMDAGSTTVGLLTQSAIEANPIVRNSPRAFAFMIAGRIVGIEYVNKLNEPQRTNNLSLLNSIWWGVDANNLILLLTHSGPLSVISGLLVGLSLWEYDREEREFMQICATEKINNPNLKCKYSKNHT